MALPRVWKLNQKCIAQMLHMRDRLRDKDSGLGIMLYSDTKDDSASKFERVI